jgi:hypothetical protein
MQTKQRARIGIVESITFILSLLVLFFVSAEFTHAQGYTPLAGLPQVQGQNQGLAAYFNRLYMVTIAVGAILAFLKISIAGVKYSLTGIVTDKEDAKKDIKGALFGLAILLIPFIVLNTIYPGLTNLNILNNAVRLTPTPASQPQSTADSSWAETCDIAVRSQSTGNPQFNPGQTQDQRDCTRLIDWCRGAECRGDPILISSGERVQCNYYVTLPSTAADSLNAEPDYCNVLRPRPR